LATLRWLRLLSSACSVPAGIAEKLGHGRDLAPACGSECPEGIGRTLRGPGPCRGFSDQPAEREQPGLAATGPAATKVWWYRTRPAPATSGPSGEYGWRTIGTRHQVNGHGTCGRKPHHRRTTVRATPTQQRQNTEQSISHTALRAHARIIRLTPYIIGSVKRRTVSTSNVNCRGLGWYDRFAATGVPLGPARLTVTKPTSTRRRSCGSHIDPGGRGVLLCRA